MVRRGVNRTQVSSVALPSAGDSGAYASDNRNILKAHVEYGSKRGGGGGYLGVVSVSLLGGVAQVESQVFTRVGLHTRRLNASADASATARTH